MKVDVVVLIGQNKENCDDTVLVNEHIFNNESATIEEDISCAFVADGVGGNPGGKDASMFLLKKISKTDFSQCIKEDIRKKLIDINNELIHYAATVPGKEKMATTLTGFLKGKNGYYMVHIGNTRMYYKQGNYLKQVSVDQTRYQVLINLRSYEEAEACNKSIITGCFGGGNNSLISTLVVEKIDQDRLPDLIVLTSDGIHDFLTIEDLEDNLVLSPELENVETIVALAIEKLSEDDKSIVVIKNK